MKTIEIIKRDGSHEPFDAAKLRSCLAAAMQNCHYDVRYATALSQAVASHLEQWERRQPPSSDYLFRCVRSVLMETGLQDVAQCLVAHRRERLASRRSLQICAGDADEPVAWDKQRVVQSLEGRYGLGRTVARVIAGEVERRVLGLGYRLISASLVEEVIRNELMAWGLIEQWQPASAAGAMAISAAPREN
jgi:hypothetical protein